MVVQCIGNSLASISADTVTFTRDEPWLVSMVLLKRGQLWRIPFFDLSSGHIDKCCHKVPTILRTEGTNAAIGRNGSWVQYHIILKERYQSLLGTDIAIAGQCRSTLKESTWYWVLGTGSTLKESTRVLGTGIAIAGRHWGDDQPVPETQSIPFSSQLLASFTIQPNSPRKYSHSLSCRVILCT